jgi:hypothetical protein
MLVDVMAAPAADLAPEELDLLHALHRRYTVRQPRAPATGVGGSDAAAAFEMS